MLSLLSRLFGLMAFPSKRRMFTTLAVILAAALVLPTVLKPLTDFLALGPRVNFIVKLNELDRAKMKEPLLKESYDRVLKDFAGTEAAPAVTPKPAPKPAPAKDGEVKKPFFLAPFFAADKLAYLAAGAAFWLIMAVLALFAEGAKPVLRLGAFLIFCMLALAGGLVSVLVGPLSPFAVHLAVMAAAELLLAAVVGTFVRELNGR